MGTGSDWDARCSRSYLFSLCWQGRSVECERRAKILSVRDVDAVDVDGVDVVVMLSSLSVSSSNSRSKRLHRPAQLRKFGCLKVAIAASNALIAFLHRACLTFYTSHRQPCFTLLTFVC